MTREVLTEDAPPPRPAKRSRVGLTIGLVTGVATTLMLALSVRTAASQNDVALAASPRGVTVVEATASDWQDSRRYVGTVEPWLEARVGPQLISGYVETVLVRPGDRVKRGDVLATLDCRNAHGGSESTASQARSLEARQQAMASEAARLENLVEGGFVSANEIEQKKAQAAATQSQLEALQAQLRTRNLEVSDCALRAPFDGEISVRNADPGSFVRPGSTVVGVIDRHLLRVTLEVPEVDVGAVSVGTGVEVKLLAIDQVARAKVSRRAPSANASTRTVRVEIDLAGIEVPVGTTADVQVGVGVPLAASMLPLVAAKVRGSTASVFVVERGIAHKRQVVILGERRGQLFVNGLEAGSEVVTQGRAALSDNERVIAKRDVVAGGTSSGGAAR